MGLDLWCDSVFDLWCEAVFDFLCDSDALWLLCLWSSTISSRGMCLPFPVAFEWCEAVLVLWCDSVLVFLCDLETLWLLLCLCSATGVASSSSWRSRRDFLPLPLEALCFLVTAWVFLGFLVLCVLVLGLVDLTGLTGLEEPPMVTMSV